MKLKQITLAVLATVAVGASAAAMADDAGVTIYGFMRAGVVNFNGNANQVWGYSSAPAHASTTNVAGRSELNFKGSENLGNGLSSVWQVSNRFATTGNGYDDQDGNFNGRGFATNDSFVGLKSDTWGRLVMGTNYGNFEDGKYDNSFVVGPDQIQGWFGNIEGHNMVRYDLPTFAGINSSIQYATGENAGSVSGTQASQHNTTLDVNYDNGFWGLSGAYTVANNQFVGGANGYGRTAGWATNSAAMGTLTQAHLTGMIQPLPSLQFAFEWERDRIASDTVNSTALYAYYTVGAAQLGLQGGVQNYSGSNKPSGLSNGKFYDAFVHYSFSKSTTGYVEVMQSKDGYMSLANGQTSGNRTMTDIGLSKSF
ncbi:MAG: porin [Paludibacterium sp.]|uniref:porin n=1 Tax=Paludibacterium sp. TaxID=1917523 RepID=UPI0025F15E6A|nr:porin [Paludibacterium sp.]MBV8046288.1 porin [Paludibacterium sp.]MBV8647713.1 porin [Paludibacterium sp.]